MVKLNKELSRRLKPEQLAVLKEYLEEILGRNVVVLAYPFGLYNDVVVEAAKEIGYEIGLTIDWGSIQNTEELMEMKRYNVTENSDLNNFLTFHED